MIRSLTKEEIARTVTPASRGWETQMQEFDFWFDTSTDIEGQVPKDLYGTFFRNGPGLTDVYGTPLSHPIDGDGMVCALTFVNGKVHFRSRYIQTRHHTEEARAHQMLYNGAMGSRVPNMDETVLKRGFRDPAHTNAFYWGGKLLACHEYALPHTIDPCTLETIGPDSLGGVLKRVKAMSAHYRYDPIKDVLAVIGFRASVRGKPSIVGIFEFDREWKLVNESEYNIDGLNYAHDFLMTENWYIFHMTPFVKTSDELTKKVMRGETSPGENMRFFPDAPSKMVFIPRNRQGEIISMNAEPCHIFHFCNCKQIGESQIEFGAVCLPKGFNMEWQYKGFLSNTNDAPGVYHAYTADLAAKKLARTCPLPVADRSCEFPTINPYRHVSPSTMPSPRYVYLMSSAKGVPLPFTDIVKYDSKGENHDSWCSNGVVGEPVFAPRLGTASAFYGDEDDGWIITQLYIPHEHRTEYIILDAKKLSQGPVCRLKMKHHIPYSFHGTFAPYVFTHPRPNL